MFSSCICDCFELYIIFVTVLLENGPLRVFQALFSVIMLHLSSKGMNICSQTNGQDSYNNSENNVTHLSSYIFVVYSYHVVILVLCVVSWAGRNIIIFCSIIIFHWLQRSYNFLPHPVLPTPESYFCHG